MAAVDKYGNTAKLGSQINMYGYPVYVNGKKTSGSLMDLYIDSGVWAGTNKQGNKYCWNNSTWQYVGKGTVTANYIQDAAPVTPSTSFTNKAARLASSLESGFVEGPAPIAKPIETGLGGSITFGDQPTELKSYALWILGAVVAVVYFMSPKKRRRR